MPSRESIEEARSGPDSEGATSLDGEINRVFFIVRPSVLFFLAILPVALHGQNATPFAAAADSFLYMKVQLEPGIKLASLKPGDLVEGKLIRSVYWRDKELLPARSHVRLVVNRLEQRRRAPNDHWPWAINVFAPRHEKYPTFRSAQVLLPDGRRMDLQVSLLSITEEVEVRAGSLKKSTKASAGSAKTPDATVRAASSAHKSASTTKGRHPGFTANLQAFVNTADFAAESGSQASLTSGETMTVPAGTQAKVILMDAVSASGSHAGDTFRARLIEPISVSSTFALPAGSVLEGSVAKAQKPRMMSRSGSLLLSFASLSNPDGTAKRIDASVEGVSLDRRSHTRVGPEGEMQGDRPGAAWTLVNLGVTGGLAKVADDGTQLILEAILSTATDVSTAGTSRIVSACVSGVFMLTRHGRDVVLPKFTEMDITFSRPVVLSAGAPSADGGNAQPKIEQ
jgi:hypothetical protein